MSFGMYDNVAILIVNGGKDPEQGKWLQLCLENIINYTKWPNYHLYLWNNNVYDLWVSEYVGRFKNVTQVEADPDEKLKHKHAVPLQRLYELSLKDHPKYIVTLDTDAFPIRSGWLEKMIHQLENGCALAGVWRDELKEKIKPYVHASCLCTTVDFIEKYKLRFDAIPKKSNVRHDTLSTFTDKALELGLNIYKLKRSNVNQFHPIIGGIYGGAIYHHGAGSRKYVHFWNEKYNIKSDYKNNRVRDITTSLLFQYPNEYLSWLKGEKTSKNILFILGMHRSGTSCLAGSLEKCGLYLGDVDRHSKYNIKGNYESTYVKALNDEILNDNSGKWDAPPEKIVAGTLHKERINKFIKEISAYSPCGIKDPRILLMVDVWFESVDCPLIVGTFRHPVAVAKSLYKRNALSEADSYSLWIRYNSKLVELHKKYNFPLIEFDLADKDNYCYQVSLFALKLGIKPDISAIQKFVSERLDHSEETSINKIPEECKKIFLYLKENSYKENMSENSFQYQLVKNMEILSNKVNLSIKYKINYTVYRLAGYVPSCLRGFLKKAKNKIIE